MELLLPSQIIMDKATLINVIADWKTISLDVLKDMVSVYRGSKPIGRTNSNYNFDSFLLESACKEGVHLINSEVTDLEYSEDGRIYLSYKDSTQNIKADFVAFAGGVNGSMGKSLDPGKNPVAYLQKVIQGFRPPKVRRTLIFELTLPDNERSIHKIKGELSFILHGSRNLKLEMISIVPKGKYITVVLIGPVIDKSGSKDNLMIINRFMQLPHIQRIFPPDVILKSICICNPNLTTGVAKHPYGNRIGIVGDMLTSNLYKDGIGSAYEISDRIAKVVLERGIDKRSLRSGFGPIIRKYKINNTLGKLVFLFIRICFNNTLFSRIIYQAVITERKDTTRNKRRLEKILWNIASGEDNYRNIILNMYHPLVIWSIIYGGLFITLRNYITELLFGLKWGNFARQTTGVPKEIFEEKTRVILEDLGKTRGVSSLDFRRMYSIRMSSPREKIFKELGKFGDFDRMYFKPRFIDVTRVSGEANIPGSIVRYNIFLKALSFNLCLVRAIPGELIHYEIMDGFGKGGILQFEIDTFIKDNVTIGSEYMLSIYVGFNFSSLLLKYLFPSFMHDVLWNHSLCQLKGIIE